MPLRPEQESNGAVDAKMSKEADDLIKDGWFSERNDLWPGQAMSLEVKSVVHRERSSLQDILIFDSTTYGRVLVLDGVIMLTERDEFAYHEMLTHIAMCAHEAPRDVCVVGGGDGGVVREVLRHTSVERVVLCEIDERVVTLSRRFLPTIARSLDDERVSIVHADGAAFLRESPDSFDVVITDSSDPVGPAETLFESAYHGTVHAALRADGIMAAQAECAWLHVHIIAPMLNDCRRHFKRVEYAYTTIPTYPSGQIGFAICAKGDGAPLAEPARVLPAEVMEKMKYYSANIHRAAFVLAEFARRALCDGASK